MTLTFMVHGRDFTVPAGFLAQYESILEQALKGDGMIKVTVTPNYKGRTLRENAYLHVLCKRLAEMAGGTAEQIKEMAKSRAVELGYPMAKDKKGIPLIGEFGICGMPSREATIAECALLIEAVHMLAAEHGYFLED